MKSCRSELDEEIQARMRDTRKLLIEHFDEDVHDRLKVNLAGTREKAGPHRPYVLGRNPAYAVGKSQLRRQ